ncbi:MAG: hypothetical protein DRN66_04100, partial [Candidatus Nanohalarchaeota archaeon]
MKKLVAITISLLAALSLGILIGLQLPTVQDTAIVPQNVTEKPVFDLTAFTSKKTVHKSALSPFYENTVRMKLPAVMIDGTGIMTTALLKITEGEGNIFFNFNNVLISPDTEQSIRNAINVASDVTGVSTGNLDFYFTLSNINASMLEGSSAGAAFCIAVISALENKSLNHDVILTGSLNHDGTIGLVSGIKEKAIIARKTGAKLFLVPYGLSKELNFTEEEYCHKYGDFDFCQNEYTPYWVDYSKEAGIEIKEIKTI